MRSVHEKAVRKRQAFDNDESNSHAWLTVLSRLRLRFDRVVILTKGRNHVRSTNHRLRTGLIGVIAVVVLSIGMPSHGRGSGASRVSRDPRPTSTRTRSVKVVTSTGGAMAEERPHRSGRPAAVHRLRRDGHAGGRPCGDRAGLGAPARCPGRRTSPTDAFRASGHQCTGGHRAGPGAGAMASPSTTASLRAPAVRETLAPQAFRDPDLIEVGAGCVGPGLEQRGQPLEPGLRQEHPEAALPSSPSPSVA